VEETDVRLPGGPRLALRRTGPSLPLTGSAPAAGGPGRPFLLVHGLASNARLWDGVAARLAAAGHPVVAVDQRGHGRSEAPGGGYDTQTCAEDLAALVDVLALDRPVVAGQSWGGNVVLTLAAGAPPRTVGAVCCVDGGWIRLSDRFSTFEDAWAVLAPPRFDGTSWAELERWARTRYAGWPDGAADAALANLRRTAGGGVCARLDRGHHREILRSLHEGDPRALYPRVRVPVLLCPAVGPVPADGEEPGARETRDAVREALAALPDGRVSWYEGADHDLHAQHPDRLAADLLALARSVAPRPAEGAA
jgi:pimeloyl-ACP methyl ester carboxylesterase